MPPILISQHRGHDNEVEPSCVAHCDQQGHSNCLFCPYMVHMGVLPVGTLWHMGVHSEEKVKHSRFLRTCWTGHCGSFGMTWDCALGKRQLLSTVLTAEEGALV